MRTREEADELRDVGRRIRQLREAQKITGAQLAEWIGCSRFHIYNIEAGRDRATPEKRRAIAIALRVPVTALEQDVAS